MIPAAGAMADDPTAQLGLTKSIAASTVQPLVPGGTVNYRVEIACSNLEPTGCVSAAVTDTIPAPLVLNPGSITVSGAPSSLATDGNTFTVTFSQTIPAGGAGLIDGTSAVITYSATLPLTVSGDANGVPLTNTATATASNATNSPLQRTATITPVVPQTLSSSIAKSFDPTTVNSVPGTAVAVSLVAGNASNLSVDTLAVQDPAETATSNPFTSLRITGIDELAPPVGADQVQLQWLDGSVAPAIWTPLPTPVPIPEDLSTLLPTSPSLDDVVGVRATFSKSGGGVIPTTPTGGQAVITLATELRESVDSITADTTIDNLASSWVTRGEQTSTPVEAPAALAVTVADLGPNLTKRYSDTSLVPGDESVATLEARNGDFAIVGMTIVEPAPGEASLLAQGLRFDGFVQGDVEWPIGATAATFAYAYNDALPSTSVTLTDPTAPLPSAESGRDVLGFSISFTGAIPPSAYAILPFTVTALAVSGTDDVTSRNVAWAQVERADGVTGEATDFADLTRTPARVNTTITKSIVPATIWSVPGSGSLLRLSAKVNSRTDDPSSTVGAQSLVVQDPAAPSSTIDAYWDRFDLTGIAPTSIPANATVDAQYWDGTAWLPIPGATGVVGPVASWSTTIDPGLRDSIQGVRLVVTPTAIGATFPPAFEFAPNLRTELRSTLRSDASQPAVDPASPTNVEVDNVAASIVTNQFADPATATDLDDATITVRPTEGGPGVDLGSKEWTVPVGDPPTVTARTGADATARISWGTEYLPLTSVRVSDPAPASSTATGLPPVETTAFDAFDLIAVAPITPAQDPLIAFDAVTGVAYFSDSTDTWVDITADVCGPSLPGACDGTFPGVELTQTQSADAVGIRIEFSESPTRDERATAPTDPAVGSGVAGSSASRPIDLEFELRDDRRSDGEAVTGRAVYNLPPSVGIVENTVRIDGIVGTTPEYTTVDGDEIVIQDVPLNLDVVKGWEFGPYGLPPVGTPLDRYPVAVATVTATNQTAARVDTLMFEDPNPAAPALESAFERLNLVDIISISVPAGTDPSGSSVSIEFETGPSPVVYSLADAQALPSTVLQTATSITVRHDGRIESAASTTAVLAFQLRATLRSDPSTEVLEGDVPDNTVLATILDPGGTAEFNGSKTDEANADIEIEAPTYGVDAAKTVTPASRYDDEANRSATVTIAGQPSGTVRSTSMTLTDDEPTFWNAYTFTRFQSITLAAPITRVTVEALVGVDYTVVPPVAPGDPETILAECAGDTDLEACWEPVGTYTGAPGSTVTPALPGSIDAADILGLRYTVDRADGANWERPYNPRQVVAFTADRRVDLVTGGPVPSTRPTIPATPPAPGETVLGRTTNTVDVNAQGSWNREMDPAVLWAAGADATDSIELLHRTNSIQIVKTPAGDVSPGTPIPFQIAVTNTGAWNMTGLAVTDTIETDGIGPRLVVPEVFPGDDPVFSSELRNAGSVLQLPAPDITATVSPDRSTIDFTMPVGFVLPAGWSLTITADLMLRGDIPANTPVGNAAAATSDRIFDRCVGATDTVLDPATLVVAECATSTVVQSLASSPLQILKGVKGDGAGLIDAAPGDANYDDLGVLALPAAPSTDYCATANGPDGYFRNPCVPITRPGGTELWRSYLTNVGNIPSPRIAMIDVLPHPDDRGVIIDQARSSRWTPEFTGDLVVDTVDVANAHAGAASTEVLYLTAAPTTICNRLDVEQGMLGRPVTAADLEPGEPAACVADVNSRPWQVYDEATTDLASVAALKIVVSYADDDDSVIEGLEPGETITLSYSSTTAPFSVRAETADRDAIAWNSIAGGALGVDPMDDAVHVSQVREARKTGVAMAQGKLDLSKVVDTPLGYPFATPSSFQFDVVCTSIGESVPLVGVPTGSPAVAPDRSRITLQPGTVLQYNSGSGAGTWANVNLPLYAECSLEELPSQGAAVTYSPTGTVTAYRTYESRTDVANKPAAAEIAPDGILSIQATNDYEYAGFTVAKAVDPGTAVDQDGVVITRPGPYSFTAVCTFLGEEVLDETFTVAAGGTHSETELPAGASCTLTENAAAGASLAETDMVVTAGGSPTTVDGKSATFTLSPNTGFAGDVVDNTVSVTNTFPTGTVRIEKTVSGPGGDEWGNESFGVRLLCTTADASPSTVYDDVLTLSKASPSVTVEDLASGATCAITETVQGGANAVTISPSTVVVDTTPATAQVVNVFNTFRVGTVRVTKVLSGNPAASLDPATGFDYEVSLACTRVVDGATVSIEIPGGATRTITGAGTADYTGLPTGAICAVTETDRGDATSATLTPADGIVTVGNGTVVGVTVTNTFANGSVSVHKSVSGDAADSAPTEFTATVSCLWEGAAVPLANDGGITLTDDATVTLQDVPVGSICSVSEDDAGQAIPNPSTPATVTVTDGTTPTVTLELSNVYATASLRVTKTVTSDAAPVPTDFGFHVRCEFLGVEVLDESFTLDADGIRDFTALPARSTCEIEETDARAGDDTIVGGTSATGTVTLDQDARLVTIDELAADDTTGIPRNSAGFENLYGVAGLVVTKSLAGAGADQFGLGEEFSVRVVCVYDGETLLDQTVELIVGTSPSHSWSDLVAGSECTITEPDLLGADAVVITPNDGDDIATGIVTVADGAAAQVDVTNWFLTGSVEVTKVFEGDAAEKFGTRLYPVQLSCERDGEAIVFTEDGIRSLSASEPTVEFTAIPTGSECELVERSTGGATSTRIIDLSDGVDGPTLAEPATAGYAFSIVTSTQTLAVQDQPQTPLGVVNRFEFAEVSAAKTVETDAVDAEGEPVQYGPFEVQLTCTLAGEPVDAAEDAIRTIAAGETVTWTELPVGAECAIDETDAADASTSSVQITQGDATDAVVPGAAAAFAPLLGLDSVNSAALVNVFEVGSVTVAKVVAGSEPERANGPFPVTLVCTLIDASHPAPGLLVREVDGLIGGTEGLVLSEDDIPSGSECSLTESDPGTANRTSISVDATIVDPSDDPVGGTTETEGTVAGFTLEAGVASSATVTVTNTFDRPLQSTGSSDLPIGIALLGLLGLGGGLLLMHRPRRGRHAR